MIYPYGLVTGLPAVGTAPCYNIFPAQQGSIINLADVVEDTEEHNRAIIARLRPGLHDDFLLSQSVVDADKGFGTQPMTWSELLRATKGRSFRLIPRCVIVQRGKYPPTEPSQPAVPSTPSPSWR